MKPVRLVSLEKSRVTSVYHDRLVAALNGFLNWLYWQNQGSAWQRDPDIANQLLAEYIEHLCKTNKPLYVATHTVAGVQFYYNHLKGQLTRATEWNAIHDRQVLEPAFIAGRILPGADYAAFRVMVYKYGQPKILGA